MFDSLEFQFFCVCVKICFQHKQLYQNFHFVQQFYILSTVPFIQNSRVFLSCVINCHSFQAKYQGYNTVFEFFHHAGRSFQGFLWAFTKIRDINDGSFIEGVNYGQYSLFIPFFLELRQSCLFDHRNQCTEFKRGIVDENSQELNKKRPSLQQLRMTCYYISV